MEVQGSAAVPEGTDLTDQLEQKLFLVGQSDRSVRSMLLLKYFIPFCDRTWRAYAKSIIFLWREKDKQLWGNNVNLHWSFSESSFSALKYWCSSYEDKLQCRWWEMADLAGCNLTLSAWSIFISPVLHCGQFSVFYWIGWGERNCLIP